MKKPCQFSLVSPAIQRLFLPLCEIHTSSLQLALTVFAYHLKTDIQIANGVYRYRHIPSQMTQTYRLKSRDDHYLPPNLRVHDLRVVNHA